QGAGACSEGPGAATPTGPAAKGRGRHARGGQGLRRPSRLRVRRGVRGGEASRQLTQCGQPANTREARTMSVRKLAILGGAVLVALGPAMLAAQGVMSYSAVT